MKNLCSFVLAFAIFFVAPFSWSAESNEASGQQPDRRVRMCGPELSTPGYEPESADETEGVGFFDSEDEFRSRIMPGVDEVQERNDDEVDALDPGTF